MTTGSEALSLIAGFNAPDDRNGAGEGSINGDKIAIDGCRERQTVVAATIGTGDENMSAMVRRFLNNETGALAVEYAVGLAFLVTILIAALSSASPEFTAANNATATELKKLQGVE